MAKIIKPIPCYQCGGEWWVEMEDKKYLCRNCYLERQKAYKTPRKEQSDTSRLKLPQ